MANAQQSKNKTHQASEYFRGVQHNQDKKKLTHWMIRKNIYFGNNLLPGTVTVIAQDQFLIISTTQYFKSFYWKKTILQTVQTKDSELTLPIELKSALVKALSNGEYLYMLVDGGLTSKYKTYTHYKIAGRCTRRMERMKC